MCVLKKMCTVVRIEESIALFIVATFFFVNSVFFSELIDPKGVLGLMVQYFSFGSPFFFYFFLVIYVVFIGKFIYALALAIVESITRLRLPTPSELRHLLSIALLPVRTLAPLALVPLFGYMLLTNMNYLWRYTQNDVAFLMADHILTGTYFLFDLSRAIVDPGIITILFIFYVSLSEFLPMLFVVLYFRRDKQMYREALLSFMITLLVAFPFFAIFPLQDPHNYFVRNLRNNELPHSIVDAAGRFLPTDTLQGYLNTMARSETATERDNSVPISCFPSMHAMWAMLIVYYFSRIDRRLLLVAVPWIVLLLFGGLLFGQHYLVDYIASLPGAILAVYLARMFLKKWGSLGTPY